MGRTYGSPTMALPSDTERKVKVKQKRGGPGPTPGERIFIFFLATEKNLNLFS